MNGHGSSDRLSLALSGGLEAPAAARRALRTLALELGPQLASLELLVTELVSNSVTHGGAGPDRHVRLQVFCGPQTVHGMVIDSGPGFTGRRLEASLNGEASLGLKILDRTAARWGVEQGGRCVWFELSRNGRDPASPV